MFGFNTKTSNTMYDAASCAPSASACASSENAVVFGTAIAIAVLSFIISVIVCNVLVALTVIIIMNVVGIIGKNAKLEFSRT